METSSPSPDATPANVVRALRSANSLTAALRAVENRAAAEHPAFPEFNRRLQAHVRSRRSVSINVRPKAMLEILRSGHIVNRHHLVTGGANRTVSVLGLATREETRRIVSMKLGYAEIETELVYGALNTGNCGASLWGPICLVLSEEDFDNRVSFLKRNSYSYVVADVGGAEYRLADEFAPDTCVSCWSNVQELVALKIGEKWLDRTFAVEGTRSSPESLDDVVAEYGEFVEAHIFAPGGELSLKNIREVRLPQHLVVRRQMLHYGVARGVELTSPDLHWYSEWGPVFEGLESSHIPVIPR